MRWFRVAVFIVCCCAVGGAATGQQQRKPLVAVLDDAQRGNWMVRLQDGGGRTTRGRIADRADTLVRLGRARVDVRNVQQVLRGSRTGGASRAGALTGGTIGAVLGFTIAAALCDGNEIHPKSGCLGPAILGTGMSVGFGSVIGLLLGEAIDPSHIEWKQVWP